MKTHVFRLRYGQDLKKEIVQYCKDHSIYAGYVASSAGCLYEAHVRLAGGETYFHEQKDYEILSINGTLSLNGVHLHIALSDVNGNVIGGHLMEGCLVHTTAEMILVELDEYEFCREYDEQTGYHELTFKQIK